MLTCRSSRWPIALHFWAVLLALLAVAVLKTDSASAAGSRGGSEDAWTLCARHTAEIEIREDLPPHLLSAISKVESGRWVASRQSVSAWPWTVTSGGKGRFYATLDEALDAVHALRASGRRNIDVGCMQVNLLHHPDAFEDMRAALDPAQNIAYAADLLQRLNREARSWPKAIAYYHSRTPSRNGPYRRKVFRFWHEEWRSANRIDQAVAVPDEMAAEPPLSGFGTDERQARTGLGQIQLGAFRVPENARAVWRKLQQENAALLSDLRPHIDVVDGGPSGELHLLRINPIMTVKLARSICNELLDRSIDCFVVAAPQRLAFQGEVRRFR